MVHYIRICRPANVITAMADVLAGISIVIFYSNALNTDIFYIPAILLLITTAALYAGGIVFNDYFDADIDRIERPERVIPSGIISKNAALVFGSVLFTIALICSAMVHLTAFLMASTIILSVLLYNFKSKQHPIAGPLNMGICRGLNLLLGISLVPDLLKQHFLLGLLPLMYIFAVTTISRDEVHGGKKKNIGIACMLYLMVFALLAFIANHTKVYIGLWLLLPFGFSILGPLLKAWKNPMPGNIVKAVKAGVLSIILLDASWAAIHHQFLICGIILCLLPISISLGKYFAVT